MLCYLDGLYCHSSVSPICVSEKRSYLWTTIYGVLGVDSQLFLPRVRIVVYLEGLGDMSCSLVIDLLYTIWFVIKA